MAAPCKRNVFNEKTVKHRRSTGVKEQNTIDYVLTDHKYEIGHVCEGREGAICVFRGCLDLREAEKYLWTNGRRGGGLSRSWIPWWGVWVAVQSVEWAALPNRANDQGRNEDWTLWLLVCYVYQLQLSLHKSYSLRKDPQTQRREKKEWVSIFLYSFSDSRDVEIFLDMPVMSFGLILNILSVRIIKYVADISILCQSEWNYVSQFLPSDTFRHHCDSVCSNQLTHKILYGYGWKFIVVLGKFMLTYCDVLI